jgi:hypothetical protein
MLQSHDDIVTHDITEPRPARPHELEILDGVARELMPAVWGLGVQCSVLRLPRDLTARERRFIDGVERNAARIARALTAMHDFVLAEQEGAVPLDPRPAEIGAICGDAVEQLRDAGLHGEIACGGEGDGAGVWDPERLSQAISYVLECALDAAADEDGLRLHWRGGTRDVVLTVTRSARPGEAQSGMDVDWGARIGAGPEDGVKTAVARRIVVQHGGTLARFGTSRAVAYVAVLPREAPEDLD